MSNYIEFLKSKACLAPESGIDLAASEFSSVLKPHQREIARWALRGGRRAIFASFGLGKTLIQLECLRLLRQNGISRALIICPLGVRQEFFRDAEKLGLSPCFIRRIDECEPQGLFVTNYETVRDGKLDPNEFDACSLDEASVLRSYGSKTYQSFLTLFSKVKYKFVATATPSPNRYKELIHYAGYLGIMDTGQALTRFFQRDSTKANNLTLYPHKEKEFWLWLSSWALFVQKPSDLGFSDEGYSLPGLKIFFHEIASDHRSAGLDKFNHGLLFRDASRSLKDAAKERRDTLNARAVKMTEIIADNPDDHFLIWHDLEVERHAIKKALPKAVEVFGSQDLEKREQNVIDFSDGKIKYLATKPILSGSGCNFQRYCHKAIFFGIGYKFNDFIQSVHRIQRFLQEKVCEIHIIHADSERPILRTLMHKWEQHNNMTQKMSDIIRERGLGRTDLAEALRRSLGVDRIEVIGDQFTAVNNDCVEECGRLAENSIDMVLTSIPFSNHYEYTPSFNDFGHTDSDHHFFEQMDFLTPHILRILKPGRVAAIHVKDRINFGNITGYGMPTVNPFHAKVLFHYLKHGFVYLGMITVVTDVVRENNQTYRLGWSEQCKDGTKMGVGSPEYIMLFRKLPSDTSDGFGDFPVVKNKAQYSRARWQIDAHAFWRSNGDRLLRPEELAKLGPNVLAKLFTDQSLKQIYDYKAHVKIGEELDVRGALPTTFMSLAPGSHSADVWHDVARMRTLNSEQSRRRLEMHVCPLQFDIVERLIERYTNPGDLVIDPFAGIMTVPLIAIQLGRRGYGIELNSQYFCDGVAYLKAHEKDRYGPTLFDLEKTETGKTGTSN